MKLVFFDFDGTLTSTDSFTSFIYFVCSPRQLLWGATKLLPWIIGYHVGMVDPSVMRQKLVNQALGGRKKTDVEKLGMEYCLQHLPNILSTTVMAKFKQHLDQGDRIVVVSASLNVYLEPWCKQHGVGLIANELEANKGCLTGRYSAPDCYKDEKKTRIQAQVELTSYEHIVVYTDSKEDGPMIELANEGYWVNPKTQIMTPMSF